MFKDQGAKNPPELSPELKRKFRELSLVFHPDRDGDVELMRDVLTAKQEAEKGKPENLIQMHDDWFTETPNSLLEIKEQLTEFSNELFEDGKKALRNRKFLISPRLALRERYLKLCQKYTVKPNVEWFLDFTYLQGWLQEEEYKKQKANIRK